MIWMHPKGDLVFKLGPTDLTQKIETVISENVVNVCQMYAISTTTIISQLIETDST